MYFCLLTPIKVIHSHIKFVIQENKVFIFFDFYVYVFSMQIKIIMRIKIFSDNYFKWKYNNINNNAVQCIRILFFQVFTNN